MWVRRYLPTYLLRCGKIVEKSAVDNKLWGLLHRVFSIKFWILALRGVKNAVDKLLRQRAVVVAQLVERLLPIPEVCGSNPVISKISTEHLFPVNCIEKTKIKKKEAGNGLIKKPLRQRQQFVFANSTEIKSAAIKF